MEYVFYIVLTISLSCYFIFSDYWEARAALKLQEARKLELENDKAEAGYED